MRGLPLLPVPPKPPVKMGWQVFDRDGNYEGFTLDEEEAKTFPKRKKKVAL